MPEDSQNNPDTRSPETPAEHLLANCRPQPAIPAVLALLLMVMMPMLSPGAAVDGWQLWLIGAGLLVSAGLAIAAGFCSFAPQVFWLMLAAWAHNLAARAALPDILMMLLFGCAVGVVLMIFLQLWRVVTGRFVPTLSTAEPEPES